jgi:hypothetical protein
MVVGSSLLAIVRSCVVQALAGRRVTPRAPSTALLVPQLTEVATMVVLTDWDALDVVVMAGDLIGVDEVLAVGVVWATEAADVAVGVLWATEAADEAFELLGATETADDATELLGATDAADVAIELLGAIGAADVAITLLGTLEVVDDTMGLLRATGTADVAIGLLDATEAADNATELLGITDVADTTIELLGTTTTLEDAKTELDTEITWLTETGWDDTIEEPVFVAARMLWGAVGVTVVALTTTKLDVIGAADDIGWFDELTTAITVFAGTILEDAATEEITLDAEGAILESATLDVEIETIWLDEMLTGAREAVEDPAIELVEGLWDAGRMLVAPLTTAILVVGVDDTMGAELGTLLATTTILEDVGIWLNALLLTWAADTTLEVVGVLWIGELTPTTTTLVTADGVEIINELTPLLTGTAALETVLLNTGEAIWLVTLLGCARINVPLTRPVVVGIVWAILDALKTPWDVDKITVVPELPMIETTAVVAEFAALAETCVEATEPAPTSARLPPPAVCTTATLVLPTPAFTR